MFEVKGKYGRALVTIDNIDENTKDQIQLMCNHPASNDQISIMPDTHLGKGCVIGFTMPMGNKIVPNWIGVDVGCGVLSTSLNMVASKISDKLESLDKSIRKEVPMGFNIRRDLSVYNEWADTFLHNINKKLEKFHKAYEYRFGLKEFKPVDNFETYLLKFVDNPNRILRSLGTVGGGNHFLEFCKSEKFGNLIFTVHTGSRNFGKQVCDYHQKKAWDQLNPDVLRKNYIDSIKKDPDIPKKDIQRLIQEWNQNNVEQEIDKHSAYLTGDDMYEYLYDMVVAQTYARFNRLIIALDVIDIVKTNNNVDKFCNFILDECDSIHNFISFKNFVIRKGSTSADPGENLVIPLNSRDGTLMCSGLGNRAWNCSAPHGAGRLMSRKRAIESISTEKATDVMDGVYASVTPQDESPLCYKDADMIKSAIQDTCVIEDRFIPIINFKS
jgi:RNA-splicing ligase RtcB